ncbi:MAG: hypothetical protein HFH64_04085 [Lachnospiraceae bacterium]|nr:hypothetical protein [Lachnospiraceae bacterium]
MKKKATYKVDRKFCEQLIALANHATNPIMDIFQADKSVKMQVVIDYDPQINKVNVTYFEETPDEESEEQTMAETTVGIEESNKEKTNRRLQKYQEGLGWLKSLEEKPEEQALAVTEDYSLSDKFKCLNNFQDETVLHYCTKQEMAEIAGRYGGLDWLIGAEKDIKSLTADMAGFKSEKSQRVIIDYDKGYRKFLVRRFDMDYGVQEVIDVAMFENWVSVNLPENCPNICISFKREIAEMQIKKFGAKPLYGFDKKKEDWLPVEVFITYGGSLAPNQRRLEV